MGKTFSENFLIIFKELIVIRIFSGEFEYILAFSCKFLNEQCCSILIDVIALGYSESLRSLKVLEEQRSVFSQYFKNFFEKL